MKEYRESIEMINDNERKKYNIKIFEKLQGLWPMISPLRIVIRALDS